MYVKGGRQRILTGGLGDLRTTALQVLHILASFSMLICFTVTVQILNDECLLRDNGGNLLMKRGNLLMVVTCL